MNILGSEKEPWNQRRRARDEDIFGALGFFWSTRIFLEHQDFSGAPGYFWSTRIFLLFRGLESKLLVSLEPTGSKYIFDWFWGRYRAETKRLDCTGTGRGVALDEMFFGLRRFFILRPFFGYIVGSVGPGGSSMYSDRNTDTDMYIDMTTDTDTHHGNVQSPKHGHGHEHRHGQGTPGIHGHIHGHGHGHVYGQGHRAQT